MPRPRFPFTLALATLGAGGLLLGILIAMVVPSRSVSRQLIEQTVISRDADILYPEALQQLAETRATAAGRPLSPEELLVPVLAAAKLTDSGGDGILAVAIFKTDGSLIQALPESSLVLPELSSDDFAQLIAEERPISHFEPDFPLDQYFARAGQRRVPVLEILLPLHTGPDPAIVGFVQYFISAQGLAQDLAGIDGRFNRETTLTLAVGAASIAVVLVSFYLGFLRHQRLMAERNNRLTRANFDLTLAAKASALGQITSHLIHGLQGPIAGLSAVVTARGTDAAGASDWRSAATYTARLQAMIQETVALLGDESAHVAYQLTGRELADTIRRRNTQAAADKGVILSVAGGFPAGVDSHRGGLLCLIAANLVQNAIAATPAGGRVDVSLRHDHDAVTLTVADEGAGIPEAVRDHLFEAGRSGRPGGTGLGLAISRLLAVQIGANLGLERTGPQGTTFQLTLPL
jgi:signal transduction histidine kinase